MKVFLISNNLLIDSLKYTEDNLDLIRSIRPLSIAGEQIAQNIANLEELVNVEAIYTSLYASSLCSAKYLSDKYALPLNLDKRLNDCKVGMLQNKTMNIVKNMQEHDFNYKLYNGESLNEVSMRMNSFINSIIRENKDIVIFTHKRSIMAYLLKHTKVGYNLDDELILGFNDKVVYANSDKDYDCYELIIEDGQIIDIYS